MGVMIFTALNLHYMLMLPHKSQLSWLIGFCSDKEITEDKDFNTPKQTNDLNINTCVSTDETDFSVSETQDDSKIKVKNIQKWREGIEIKTVLSDRENCEGPSFGQVIDMVSKGIPLPGLTDLEIKPLDMEPTMTKMERKAKPWEQG
ncbi:uncharacterized protein [Magallana gigas]|uniref:uncharacterized protein isoform X3 n=1 Tax=Magallana gigas TaxID=29159 RepID=UPI00334250C7